jgi:integrase
MGRKANQLNARRVATLTKPGRHADGGNLYLSVTGAGARSWVFMFRWHGKQRELGFGSARDVTLARARELATEARAKLAEGIAPASPRSSTAGSTFAECADRLIEAMKPGWRSTKHTAQWEATMRVHAAPLRRLPVNEITTEDVLSVLKPLWNDKHETASRLRSRIEQVLDAARAQGLRGGENPARWRGHLDQLLPRRQRLEQAHHAAMAYSDVPGFMGELREREGTAARALEFLILTAARRGEVLGARREEFDLEALTWTVPASRMKGGREHVVPLPPRAVEIVRGMPASELVFRGQKPGKPISPPSLELVLKRLRPAGATMHGFRSSFRDWAGDCTNHPRDVVEAALAHAIENKAEAAYRRSTAIEKRRKLMDAWAAYCDQPAAGAKVVSINSRNPL